MKGLIIKDFLLLKESLKTFITVAVLFTLFALTGIDFDVSLMLPLVALMMFLATFSLDEVSNWDAYAVTLPIGRQNIVKSKYLAAVLVLLGSAVLGVLVSFVGALIAQSAFDLRSALFGMLGTISLLMVALGAILPCAYRFGIEKGRIVLSVTTFSLVAISVLAANFVDSANFTALINFFYNSENIWLISMPVVMLFGATVALMLSYFVSSKIYQKKEF